MSFDGEYKDQNGAARGRVSKTGEEALFADADSNVDAGQEDRDAAESERSMRIPQSEINDLKATGVVEETATRTRGIKNDAMKQERDIDLAFE